MPAEDIAAPFIATGASGPKVAILREQGVNGQIEMAAAFDRAGFDAFDVHMSDLIAGRVRLADFNGLAACGGFSYGDVLGAGRGWATSILERNALRDMFAAFFARDNTFSLGVCNGCQMMSQLRGHHPRREHWPRFLRNASEQFEARLACWKCRSRRRCSCAAWPVRASRWRWRMAKAAPSFDSGIDQCGRDVALRYVDRRRRVATAYPPIPTARPTASPA
jgi:phosphoribosylformylglycinamidine synthase